MVIFDKSKLRVVHVKLKECTQALGGSVRILDEEHFERTGVEKYKRIPTPMYLVRRFQMAHEQSKYLTPIESVLVYYEDVVVCIERAAYVKQERVTEGVFDEERHWISIAERNIRNFLMPTVERSEDRFVWFIDGRYVFRLNTPDVTNVIRTADFLSEDGKFRRVPVAAYDLADLCEPTENEIKERSCVAYVAANGQYAVTAPIWSGSMSGIGSSNLRDSDAEANHRFDRIDAALQVNLNFALAAANDIGNLYGPEFIEPLMLDELMIRLKTVNLPKVANAVKQTYAIDMGFKDAFAWLIGLSQRSDDLQTHMVIRGLLKYLTTRGFFRNTLFDSKHVYRDGQNESPIKKVSREQALEDSKGFDDDLCAILKTRRRSRMEMDEVEIDMIDGLDSYDG